MRAASRARTRSCPGRPAASSAWCARRDAAGFGKIIGFDMGGTSTDVSHYAGEFEREFETQVAGVRMRAPMMSIHTVAAGGGSILHFDGARFRVGPGFGRRQPGPGVLPRGGPLTVTDCNVMLGKIQPRFFPRCSGRGRRAARCRGRAARSSPRSRRRSSRPPASAHARGGRRGLLDIAVGNMANAIKKISVQRGHDVTDTRCAASAARRPARLPGRRCARHDARLHPSARRRALGLRHGARRPQRDARAGGRGDARRRQPAALRSDARAARQRRARRTADARASPAGRVRIVQRVHLRYEGTDTALVVAFGALADDGRAVRGRLPQRFAS